MNYSTFEPTGGEKIPLLAAKPLYEGKATF